MIDYSQSSREPYLSSFQKYQEEIGPIPPITTYEEQIELTRAVIANNEKSEEARQKLIRGNLRLVIIIANYFKGRGVSFPDLVSEGNLGLMNSVKKYKESKGAKFSSYAAWWIKQSMRRALANQSRTIRIPANAISKLDKIRIAKSKLEEVLGRKVSNDEIGDDVDLSSRVIKRLNNVAQRTFSLNDTIFLDSEEEYQENIIDEYPNQEKLFELSEVYSLLDCLKDKRERDAIIFNFGLDNGTPKTIEQTSRKVGYSIERTRQFKFSALRKIRKYLNLY